MLLGLEELEKLAHVKCVRLFHEVSGHRGKKFH